MISRREFLKRTVLSGAGLTVLPLLPTESELAQPDSGYDYAPFVYNPHSRFILAPNYSLFREYCRRKGVNHRRLVYVSSYEMVAGTDEPIGVLMGDEDGSFRWPDSQFDLWIALTTRRYELVPIVM